MFALQFLIHLMGLNHQLDRSFNTCTCEFWNQYGEISSGSVIVLCLGDGIDAILRSRLRCHINYVGTGLPASAAHWRVLPAGSMMLDSQHHHKERKAKYWSSTDNVNALGFTPLPCDAVLPDFLVTWSTNVPLKQENKNDVKPQFKHWQIVGMSAVYMISRVSW